MFPFKIKVHVNTMASSMKRALYKEIKRVKRWGRSGHFIEALKHRDIIIPIERLPELIKEGELIEFHTNKVSRRVLIRHMSTGICMTLNLDSHDVLTGWYNAPDDTHQNLDKDEYLFL